MTKDIKLNSNYSNANTSSNVSIGPESYRTPTDAEFWSVFQKWFAFEEPSNKWSQIRKALKKLIRRGSDKVVDSLSLQQQGVLFSHIFSTSSMKTNSETLDRSAEKLLSLVIAAEDIKRFNRIAFDSWLNDASSTTSACAYGGIESSADNADEEPLSISISGYATGFDISIADDAALSQSELLWIENSMNAAPGWMTLREDGPWKGDSRAQLLVTFLDQIQVYLNNECSQPFSQEVVDHALALWSGLVRNSRAALPGSFLPSILLFVEGQTECILIPAISKLLATDLDVMAVDITDCGGAKQVVKQYLNLKDVSVLPTVCVLDSDVAEPAEIISDSLRDTDRLITLSHKEIEDTFSEGTFMRLLNIYMTARANHHTGAPLTLTELHELEPNETGRTVVLDRLLRARGMGSFDKIEFARVAAERLQATEIPPDGEKIVETLQEIHNDGIKFRY